MALSRSVGPEGRVQPWKPPSKRERSVQGHADVVGKRQGEAQWGDL